MSTVILRGYKATDIEFHGHLPNKTQINLDNKYSYNVRYGKDNICVATLECRIFDRESPESFSVSVALEGIFSFSSGYSKEQLHILTYKELFPYARALVTTITSAACIPPVMLPCADIENQNIYRIDTGNIKP